MLISEKSLIIKKVFILIVNCTKTKKSSLFLLMYFQVEKQEVHGHPSSVQKEFTVLTNVLPSRKIQKATALKKHCNHKLYLYKNHCNSAKVICSPKLYGKYKNTRVTVLKKTVIIKCIYTRVTCSTKHFSSRIGTKVPKTVKL